ncbi:rhamnosyltransferase [Cupriavidus sp. BIC8F]|uniref:rhamnosyltransferase n=1 Tax=Cupriavidus sp. BIC8F TaxID=3079014 RepID=UPI0039672894
MSFRPDLGALQQLLLALCAQVRVVYVVDNGSGHAVVELLSSFAAGRNIELIALPINCGIAAAHNIGIRRVAELGLEYVVLFDQDSLPAADMIDRLVDAQRLLAAHGARVAAVGPVSVDRRTGTLGKFVRVQSGRICRVACGAPDDMMETDFLISSGSLIPMAVIEAVGEMKEGYFIDHVDTEWCLRARMAGWQIFGVCTARLTHALGDHVIRVWFGRWREVSVHSPLRDYYILRNAVLMLRQSPMTWSWRFAHLGRIVQFLVFFGLAVPPRRRRFAMMMKGIWHGVIGRMGAY